MPPMETSFRCQKALLWARGEKAQAFDSYGQPKVLPPVEIDVRWVFTQTEMSDPQGNPVTVDATVVVDRDVKVGSTMWLGELEDFYGTGTGSGSASFETQIMEVVVVKKTEDLKGRAIRRTLGLKFLKSDLPESAHG